jgi:hypothetical protein
VKVVPAREYAVRENEEYGHATATRFSVLGQAIEVIEAR